MGTDIHPAIEVKIDGKWHWLGKYLPKGVSKRAACPVATGRCYLLFAILADVRNGYGFAGSYRHEPIAPISSPRGLPLDIDPELLKASEEEWLLGDHSFSYLTAEELTKFDWDQLVEEGGYIPESDYALFLASGRKEPQSYHGGGGGPDQVYLDEEEYVSNKRNNLLDSSKQYHIFVRWGQKISQSLPWETYWSWSRLRSHVLDYNSKECIEDIRVVFGFDS